MIVNARPADGPLGVLLVLNSFAVNMCVPSEIALVVIDQAPDISAIADPTWVKPS